MIQVRVSYPKDHILNQTLDEQFKCDHHGQAGVQLFLANYEAATGCLKMAEQ